jgi:hypothetical protein
MQDEIQKETQNLPAFMATEYEQGRLCKIFDGNQRE